MLDFLPFSLASMLVISTNGRHHLYYSVFEAGNVTYGPLFYVFQMIYYICIISGSVTCVHSRKNFSIVRFVIDFDALPHPSDDIG